LQSNSFTLVVLSMILPSFQVDGNRIGEEESLRREESEQDATRHQLADPVHTGQTSRSKTGFKTLL
jgi:hypothetical protein